MRRGLDRRIRWQAVSIAFPRSILYTSKKASPPNRNAQCQCRAVLSVACHHYALPLPPPPLRLRVTGLWVPPFRSFDSSLLGALPSRSHIWPDLARNALSRFFLFYLTDWYSALVRLLPSNFSPFHFRFSWFLLSDDLPVYDFLW